MGTAGDKFRFAVKAPASGYAGGDKDNFEIFESIKTQLGDKVKAFCEDPGNINEGARKPSDFRALGWEEGEAITYTCDATYTLHGSAQRTCKANGLFSGGQPICLQ